ncbi:MAG: malonyl-CoA decarboxylase [Methyloligellaceae bacterium]
MNVSFFQELLNTIGERGRSLLDFKTGSDGKDSIEDLSRALLSSRGEASGVAIASSILNQYRELDDAEKKAFLSFLGTEFRPDPDRVAAAARAYLDDPTPKALEELAEVVESPVQEFFRRLNLAPGATARIVAMRQDLLHLCSQDPVLQALDRDLLHLLGSWFNRGFLVMRRIDWSTPASILEKIIEYEAVHEISGWEDLRRRLDPRDRRCFGFFHPSLNDEPLIFVEVALTDEIPGSIQALLSGEAEPTPKPTTAVFYSISNCQEGLRGISFGNFLIKQVAEDLSREIPSLKTFVTLSPVPRFAAWLVRMQAEGLLSDEDLEALKTLEDSGWPAHRDSRNRLKETLLPLAAEYFLTARTRHGKPVDPVARFHLGNGARLERINWLGDKSAKGLRQSHGLMVNYLYDLRYIEQNHEAFVNEGVIAASKAVHSLLRDKSKLAGDRAASSKGRSAQSKKKKEDHVLQE